MTNPNNAGEIQTRLDLPLDAQGLDRLRAGMRLAFADATADRMILTGLTAGTAGRAFHKIVASARKQLMFDSLLARVGRGPAANRDRPFIEARSTPAGPALALILHLSCDLEGDELEGLFGRSADELGRDLMTARRVIDPGCPRPCERFLPAIGRYRDRQLDPEDRLELLGHTANCDTCRRTLEFARALDDDLLGEIARIQATLPALPAARPRDELRRKAAVGLLGVVVLTLTLAGLAALLNRTTAGDAPPAPLSAGRTPGYTGWVLSVGQNGLIEAFNLRTNDVVEVLPEWSAPSQQWATVALASPDFKLLAVVNIDPTAGSRSTRVQIMTLDGARILEQYWDGEGAYQYPVGWLDNHTLLFVSHPEYREDMESEYDHLLLTETRLFSLDVRSGIRSDLLVGVGGASVSPSGDAVAVLGVYDSSKIGQTVTVYALEDGRIGTVLAVVRDRVRSDPTWAPDGSVVVMALATEAAAEQFAGLPGAPNYRYGPAVPVNILSIDRQGNQTVLAPDSDFIDAYPFAVLPDATSVVFMARSSALSAPDETWLLSGDGSRTPFFGGSAAQFFGTALPAPDGMATLVALTGTSFLTPDAHLGATNALTSQSLLVLSEDGQPRNVHSSYSSRGLSAFAWLPEDAIAAEGSTSVLQEQGSGYGLEPVAELEAGDVLGTTGSMNGGGGYVVLTDGKLGVPVIWNISDGRARRLGSSIEQLLWTGDGNELLGVVSGTQAPQRGSRIGIVGNPILDGGNGIYTPPFLDPALLGADLLRRYTLPLLAPDGKQLAFFVVNPETRIVELWLAGWERPAAPVSRFRFATDSLIDMHVAALWLDDATFIFAQPAGWKDGLPRQIEIMRLNTLDPVHPLVDRITTIQATGADRGVMLRELRQSPDGTALAWRIRHYKEIAANRGRVDSIEVVGVQDANDRLEVARANPGDGLTWSPDGAWLAAGLERRVALLSADGLVFEYLTPDNAAAERPVWVSNDELWFNLSDDGSVRVWRVRIE